MSSSAPPELPSPVAQAQAHRQWGNPSRVHALKGRGAVLGDMTLGLLAFAGGIAGFVLLYVWTYDSVGRPAGAKSLAWASLGGVAWGLYTMIKNGAWSLFRSPQGAYVYPYGLIHRFGKVAVDVAWDEIAELKIFSEAGTSGTPSRCVVLTHDRRMVQLTDAIIDFDHLVKTIEHEARTRERPVTRAPV